MHSDRSLPARFRISCPGLRKPMNREHWGIRLVRGFLGRTTHSSLLLEADSVPIGTTAVPCRDATAEGVSTNEPHESADLPQNVRGSRPASRVSKDSLSMGTGRQASLPADPWRPPPLPGQRDPGARGGAADVASDAGRATGRAPVAIAPASRSAGKRSPPDGRRRRPPAPRRIHLSRGGCVQRLLQQDAGAAQARIDHHAVHHGLHHVEPAAPAL
jgi:hypothetical protein